MISKLLNARKASLIHYSPYSSILEIDKELIFNSLIKPQVLDETNLKFEIWEDGILNVFILKHLKWDSEFCNIPTYKLEFVLYDHDNISILINSINKFIDIFYKDEDKYLFIEIPPEDIFLIQALGVCGFRLIETRLNHYLDNLDNYSYERFRTKMASDDDVEDICEAARCTKNLYDRLHADVLFNNSIADSYLEIYAKNAVNGFCDFVLVPDEPNVPAKAFMAASYLKEDSSLLNISFGRLKLSAISPTCKGWYIKLASESIYEFKNHGVKYVLVTTQSTNRAAFRSSEKLGFRLGCVTHVFSYSKKLS